MTQPNESVLQVQNLTIAFDNSIVCSDINLSLQGHSITALIVPSGAGKSSLLLAMGDLLKTIHPRARVDGQIRWRVSSPQIGFVFQKPLPFPISIFDNIALALRERGISGAKLSDAVERSLVCAGLWTEVKDRLKDGAYKLSGGQQQRLCLARAVALRPQVLFLDEPCSSIDPLNTEIIEEQLRQIKKSTSVVIVTHNLQQAKRLSDEVNIMWNFGSGGRIIEHGHTAEVFANPKHELVRKYISGFLG